jgi:hypothetical protein
MKKKEEKKEFTFKRLNLEKITEEWINEMEVFLIDKGFKKYSVCPLGERFVFKKPISKDYSICVRVFNRRGWDVKFSCDIYEDYMRTALLMESHMIELDEFEEIAKSYINSIKPKTLHLIRSYTKNIDKNSELSKMNETFFKYFKKGGDEGESRIFTEKEEGTFIHKLNLTEEQVWHIVREWYTLGMYADILQDENGLDLEEICESYLYN